MLFDCSLISYNKYNIQIFLFFFSFLCDLVIIIESKLTLEKKYFQFCWKF